MTQIQKINEELNREIFADPATIRTWLATVFVGFSEALMKQAVFEMRMRGISLEDIAKKRVYAIKYGEKYSIVFSIDHARVIAQQNGIIGSAKAEYEFSESKLIACTCTVKKKVNGEVGEFSSTAFLDEFNTGRNMWAKMPKHMLAKTAEMHALRKAFPDVLDKAYVEEEVEGNAGAIEVIPSDQQDEINSLKTLTDLNDYYKANKGKGKAFDKAIVSRKAELEADMAQGSDPTDSRVVPDEVA